MDKELFDLCRQVEEKTGWKDTPEVWHSYEYGVSLYSSDYLLDKLLKAFPVEYCETELTTAVMDYELGMKWRAETKREGGLHKICESNTPLKALLKLTLALANAGELEVKS